MAWVLAALIGYLLGSIPFGLLLARAAGLGDVRAIGSGNIGATNVLRTGRKDIAAATLVLDAGKAVAAVLVASYAFDTPSAAPLAAAMAFVGHCFPVWLKFAGGKGVATYLGAALSLVPALGLALCGVWLLTAVAFRYSSLAALVAAAVAPALAALAGHMDVAAALLAMAVIVFIRHKANIVRLLNGTESRIGAGKSGGAAR